MLNYSEILSAALTLPPHERGELDEVLWESVDEPTDTGDNQPDISAAWRDQIARRSAAYLRGDLTAIPWNQVRDEVRVACLKVNRKGEVCLQARRAGKK